MEVKNPSVSSDEKKFIHDISSPLGTAICRLDVAIEDLRAQPAADPGCLEQIEKAYGSLQKARQLLEARRQLLHNLEGLPNACP